MVSFKIESRYLKLCNEFRAVIRCIKAVFYRADYQKLLICPLIKRLGGAFVSKHAAAPLKGSAELLKQSVELLRFPEKTRSSAECLKSLAACLCYSTVHAVPISHGTLEIICQKSLLNAPKRLQRILLKLQRYNLKVWYKRGKEMYIANINSTNSKVEHFHIFY